MAIPISPSRARRASPLAVALAVALFAATALAQQQPPEADATPEIRAIPLADVPARSEATASELEAVLPGDASLEALRQIESDLDRVKEDTASRVASIQSVLAETPTVRRLQDLEQQILGLRHQLDVPDGALEGELEKLGEALARLETTAQVWKATSDEAQRARASEPVRQRIASTRREIDRVRKELVAHRNQILTLRDGLVDPKASLDRIADQVRGEIAARVEGIVSFDRPPLWSAAMRTAIREELQEDWTQPLAERLARVGQYAGEQKQLLGFQVALFIVLFLGLRAAGTRARARAEENYDLREAERLFETPASMALFIALALVPRFHPLMPYLLWQLLATVSVVPVVLIVRRLAPPAMLPLVLGFPVFFAIDRVRDILETLPTIERLVLTAELAGALGFLLWLVRPSRFAQIPPEILREPFFRVVGRALRVAIVLLALALAADVGGLGNFADLIGNGTLRSAYMALFFYTILKVVQSLVAYALVLRPLRLLRMVSRHRGLVRRRLDRGMRALAVVAWIYMTFVNFGMDAAGRSALAGLLGAELSVGAVSVSLGDFLVFALAIWLSFALSRFVTFFLEEDIYPRVRLARGVPYAVSNLVRYTLIFLGFMFALAAAGIELSKLTVIAGGLGVGIGFGLQSVVNNFVSGLILLFERPLQVGDVVQIPSQDLWGEIRRIGIRASVIRTWEGGEVIVPNGHLISESVTNWTLSDRQRRVEVTVGVEYGTEAQRVIDLLLEVARNHPQVLAEPEPRAFFTDFGDSALLFLLRTWIPDFQGGFSVRSELAVEIQRALAEAGIGVPFPQRDLHLRSVSESAAAELGRGSGDEK
jgi:small-conductance mechanosensitive channel